MDDWRAGSSTLSKISCLQRNFEKKSILCKQSKIENFSDKIFKMYS